MYVSLVFCLFMQVWPNPLNPRIYDPESVVTDADGPREAFSV